MTNNSEIALVITGHRDNKYDYIRASLEVWKITAITYTTINKLNDKPNSNNLYKLSRSEIKHVIDSFVNDPGEIKIPKNTLNYISRVGKESVKIRDNSYSLIVFSFTNKNDSNVKENAYFRFEN